MLARALHHVYGPLVYAFSLSRLNSRGRLPIPRDPPVAHASGHDPDRILIIGGLAVRGLGVASHELGLAGRLARALSHLTGGGADVEARGFGHFDARRAAAEIRAIDLGRFDAIVVQVGAFELLSLRPVSVWQTDLGEVIRVISETTPPGTPVLMLGTPPLPPITGAGNVMDAAYTRYMQRMNEVTRAACEESAVVQFVPLLADTSGTAFGQNTTLNYARWADDIAPYLHAALGNAVPHDERIDEAKRQQALDTLSLTRARDIRLERIVRMARVVFGTSAAALTIIDGEKQWMKSVIGEMDDTDLPRNEAACARTISSPGVLVVEDLELDPQMSGLSWVGGDDGKRFYAGYPLEAPGGQRIGALCVLDAAPRTFTSDEVSLLRDLALRAQALLWETD